VKVVQELTGESAKQVEDAGMPLGKMAESPNSATESCNLSYHTGHGVFKGQ